MKVMKAPRRGPGRPPRNAFVEQPSLLEQPARPPPTWRVIPYIQAIPESYDRGFVRGQFADIEMGLQVVTEDIRLAVEGENQCVFCLENELSRVAIPCGHHLYCRNCALETVRSPAFEFLY